MSLPDPLPIEPIDRFDLTIEDLPGSKSVTNRALLLGCLASPADEDSPTVLSNVLFADDTRVMIHALQALGYELWIDEPQRRVVIYHGDFVVCNSIRPPEALKLSLGNAGTAYRFLTALCCMGSGFYELDGVPRMRQRPIGQLVDLLRRLGARIDYLGEAGYPPLRITGTGLRGGELLVQPTLSSQYISAILMIAPGFDEAMTLRFEGPITSQPYVEMTVRMMRSFGAAVEMSDDFRTIVIDRPRHGSAYTGCDYAIEPDASNASYFLAAAAITPGSRCRVTGLGRESLQGDSRFYTVLKRMGAATEVGDDFIEVRAGDGLRGIDIDLNDMPDMAQTLAVAALFAEGPTVIRNIGNLRVKETDRMEALRAELTKLGASVRIDGDDLHIIPPLGAKLTPADIDTYDDHRMAMSFAVAGLRAPGVRIKDPGCVNKTFVQYFDYLSRLRGDSGRADGQGHRP